MIAQWVIALAVLSVGGWLGVGILLAGIRCHVFGSKKVQLRDSFGPLDLWLGSTERIAAALMFVWGVTALPAFIGGWIALKLAANWSRFKSTKDEITSGTLIALIGNVLSFALAMVVGYCLNPNAVKAFTE